MEASQANEVADDISTSTSTSNAKTRKRFMG